MTRRARGAAAAPAAPVGGPTGVFIHRHMRIAPEPQSLRRILAGQSKELHILIAFDLVPVWISLALRHA